MSGFNAAEQAAMVRALALAARARGRTRPNPMVGCVILRDGVPIAEGYHARPGADHAEPAALRTIGFDARGCTLVVTLEPCCHHGRTPPCTDAILRAGVVRVVAAVRDPDPRVAGGGFARLRAAGIDCAEGLMEAEARALNEPFFVERSARRPYVHVKVAASLDGRIAADPAAPPNAPGARPGTTSGPDAAARVHALRAALDAILVGAGTIRADDPQLTARGAPDAPQPLRVVLDPRATLGDITPAPRVLSGPAPGTLVFVAPDAPADRIDALHDRGAETVALPGPPFDPAAVLRALHARGVQGVLVEGGAHTIGGFAAAGLVDRLTVIVSPRLYGAGGVPFAAAALPRPLTLIEPTTTPAGADTIVTGRLTRVGLAATGDDDT